MAVKQQVGMDNEHDVNLQFLYNVRNNIFQDPKTKAVVIMKRNDDTSVYTVNEEENVLLSFST